jgi:hypothetical protein
MMNPVRTTPNAPGKARSLLWPKLVAIFGVTFLLFLVLFLAYDIVTGLGERTIRLSQVSSQAAPIVIDPKIADELAKVLATNDAAVAFDVNDPFVDRAGLSGTVGTTTVGGTTQTTTAGGTKPPSTSSANQIIAGAGGSNNGNTGPQVLLPIESTKDRYQAWLGQSANNADLLINPRIFAVDDLRPVGIVDGGSGGQEVMFISLAAGKTLSFPVGTMFYDGWLSELRSEGVVFNLNDGRGTTRTVLWARAAPAGD